MLSSFLKSGCRSINFLIFSSDLSDLLLNRLISSFLNNLLDIGINFLSVEASFFEVCLQIVREGYNRIRDLRRFDFFTVKEVVDIRLKASDNGADLLETIFGCEVDFADNFIRWEGVLNKLILVDLFWEVKSFKYFVKNLLNNFSGVWHDSLRLWLISESTISIDAPVFGTGAIGPCADGDSGDDIVVHELNNDGGDDVLDQLVLSSGGRRELGWVNLMQDVGENNIKVQLNVADWLGGLRDRLSPLLFVKAARASTGWHAGHNRAAAVALLMGSFNVRESGLGKSKST